jgi:hypothetical protein
MSFVGLSVMDQRWVVPQILIIDRKGQVVAQSDPKGEKTPNLQKEDYLRTYLSGLLESGGSASKGGSSKSGDTKKAPSKPVDKKTT